MRISAVAMGFLLGVGVGGALMHWVVPAPRAALTSSASTRSVGPAASADRVSAPAGPAKEKSPSSPRAWLEAWIAAGADPAQAEAAAGQVARWAEQDADAALQFVASAARFPERLEALRFPLARIAARNLPAALLWMKEHLTQPERGLVGTDILHDLAEQNLELALEFAFAPGVPIDRFEFARLISGLTRTQPAAALTYFARLSEEGRRLTAEQMVRTWAAADRSAAQRWVEAQAGQAHQKEAALGLVHALATTAPDEVGALIQRLGLEPADLIEHRFGLSSLPVEGTLALLPHVPASERPMLVQEIVNDELPRDAELAWKLARETLSPEQAAAAITEAWERWNQSDGLAARAWAQGNLDPALRTVIEDAIAAEDVARDPAAFLTAAANSPALRANSNRLRQALSAISNLDPARAAAWLAQLQPAQADLLYREVAYNWALRDQAAAQRWADTVPAGATRDAVLRTLAQHHVREAHYEQAFTLIERTDNSATQLQLRWETLNQIYRRDATAAQSWLERQPLSPEVRANWWTLMNRR